MSLNSTRVDSRFSRSSPVISESFHLNSEKNCVLDFSSCLGSSSSNLCSSRSSRRMRCWMGVCSDSYPGFSGVGNQNFSSVCSDGSTCVRALTYATTSSRSVSRLRASISTARIDFVSSGFRFVILLVSYVVLLYRGSLWCSLSLSRLVCLGQWLLLGLL